MPYIWDPEADALFVWVAGGVWRHEKRRREGNYMINETNLFDRVGDFLDVLNKYNPFDMARDNFKTATIRNHVSTKKIYWKEPQWVERPSWLSEDVLKGQFGEIGLEALDESTSRLRRATGTDTDEWRERVQKRKTILQKHEILAAENREFLRQEEETARRREKTKRERFVRKEKKEAEWRQEEAQRLKNWREDEEKLREQEFKSGVEKLDFTKDAQDTQSSENLSWADLSASSSLLPDPKFGLHSGGFRPGVKTNVPLPLFDSRQRRRFEDW